MKTGPTQACNQDDATGFVRLSALRMEVAVEAQARHQEGPSATV